jgi:hypothetical protein
VTFCWGANSCGQLGLRQLDDKRIRKDADGIPHLPVPLPIDALADVKIVAIACGEAHSLAVTAIGDLYSWGACSCGQLGLGTYQGLPMDNDGYPYQSTPTRVHGFEGKAVTTVACGGVHNLAITEPDTDLVMSLGELIVGQESGILSDVTFRVKGGAEYHAHKCILHARAPALLDVVSNGIGLLEETSSAVFRDLLYFVYTNDVASYTAKENLGSILELYDLAMRFKLHVLSANSRTVLRDLLGYSDPGIGRDIGPGDDSSWGVVFLSGGRALVLDAQSYAETLRRGTPLELRDVVDRHQPISIQESFTMLLESQVYSDVALVIRDHDAATDVQIKRRAHKIVLAARSDYFKALFSSEFMESSAEEVTLEDIREDQLDALLRFIYADEWAEEVGYALDMLPIADRYATIELKRLLERFLVKALQPANLEIAAQVFALADRYSCPRLRGRCVAFMGEEENFNIIVKTQAFAELDKRLILEVLQQAHKPQQQQMENFPGHSIAKGSQPRDMHRRGWLTSPFPTGGARAGGRSSPTRANGASAAGGGNALEDPSDDESSNADLSEMEPIEGN